MAIRGGHSTVFCQSSQPCGLWGVGVPSATLLVPRWEFLLHLPNLYSEQTSVGDAVQSSRGRISSALGS